MLIIAIFPFMTCQRRDSDFISRADICFVENQSLKARKYKKEFDCLFEAWENDWRTNPKTRFSSNTDDARKLNTYSPLLCMGDSIVPLLMEKLLEPNNFFALVLYEDIQYKRVHEKQKAYKGGEQEKVKKMIKQWIFESKRGD